MHLLWFRIRTAFLFVLVTAVSAPMGAAAPSQDVPVSGETSGAPRLVEYELVVGETRQAMAGAVVDTLTLNGGIPGPVLRFTEGDLARITVRNSLPYQDTSIHWHGLLVPNVMDGVPYLTTPAIPPGGERVFEFTLRQTGTYWYHSHSGLQEQRGVYGAIVIEPRESDGLADRDHVVVLSDWTDEHPGEVMRTLVRGSDWYSQRKGTAQTLLGAYRRGHLGAFFEREGNRMPPMDLSDVAYDAFLANGREVLDLAAEPGERIRLRFVNAGASSYFHLSSATEALEIVASDGMAVKPVVVRRLLMGMAETYDVVITMPDSGSAVEVRATAQDGSGFASIRLGSGPLLGAQSPPRANLYTMAESVAAGIESVNPERGMNAQTAERPFAPYALLEAPEDSTLVQNAEDEARVREITLRLTGNMQRYRWGFNGKTLAEDAVIPVEAGEILRIELINDTMMHHPLHLHGHFFRLLNGKGARSPIKHTVDVPPMGKRVIEWVANEEPRDWFFHCHLLYHMDAGMARVFSYAGQGPRHRPSLNPKMLNPGYLLFDATVMSHLTTGQATVMKGRNDFLVRWEAGIGDFQSREEGDDENPDREIDLAWSRYLNANLSTIAGYRFAEVRGAEDRAFAGVRYRLPYLIQSELTADDRGDLRVELEKSYLVTNRLSAFAGAQYDTGTDGEWTVGLGWTLSKAFGLSASFHSDHGGGAGLSIRL